MEVETNSRFFVRWHQSGDALRNVTTLTAAPSSKQRG